MYGNHWDRKSNYLWADMSLTGQHGRKQYGQQSEVQTPVCWLWRPSLFRTMVQKKLWILLKPVQLKTFNTDLNKAKCQISIKTSRKKSHFEPKLPPVSQCYHSVKERWPLCLQMRTATWLCCRSSAALEPVFIISSWFLPDFTPK